MFEQELDKKEDVEEIKKHQEIIDNMNLLENKVVFDTQNICNFKNTYKL